MTTPADTLVLDTTLIAQLRADGLDYDQEFAVENRPEDSHFSFDLPIDKWLKNLMPTSNSGRMFSAIILGVLVIVVAIVLMRKKFEAPAKRLTLDTDEEDTIYGVDFAAALQQAEEERNYVQCVRLRYLQLLRLMHDQHKIFWQPGKTSTQYVAEAKLEPFAALTRIFMRVRYGKYPADERLYAKVKELANEVEQLMVAPEAGKEAEA